MSVPNIQIRNASLAYGEALLFSQLNIDLPAGKWISLLGPSGIGKSSLLRLIAGLVRPQEKTSAHIVTANDIPLIQQIAYMGQTDLLLPWLTVLENATLGMKLRAAGRAKYAASRTKATLLLEKVGLGKAIHFYPRQLSGGMRQRAALVRVLMEDKPIVLMDEPFSALDTITRYKLQEIAAEFLQEKTVLFITHDPAEALRLANDIYIMQGQPATLKHVINLSSNTPRDLSDPSVIQLQTLLFKALTQAAGELL